MAQLLPLFGLPWNLFFMDCSSSSTSHWMHINLAGRDTWVPDMSLVVFISWYGILHLVLVCYCSNVRSHSYQRSPRLNFLELPCQVAASYFPIITCSCTRFSRWSPTSLQEVSKSQNLPLPEPHIWPRSQQIILACNVILVFSFFVLVYFFFGFTQCSWTNAMTLNRPF